MSGLSNFTNNFLNKVLVAPVNINDLDEARRVQLPAGLKVFVSKGLRYGVTEEHTVAPTGSKYVHLHTNVYFLDTTDELAGYLRVHSDKSVPLGDARMHFSVLDTSTRASNSIHGDINITKDGLDIKSNYTVNVVINEDDIGDGYYRVFTGSGRKRLLEVGDRVFKYGEQGYDIYHAGNKPTKADVGLSKVENLTRAEILAGYTNTVDLNAALGTKLGKTERAFDTGLFEGDSKATVIANARSGLAPNTLATTTAHGLMSKDDKVKINSLSNYSLPTASASVLGGVKIGANIGITSGVISVAQASASALGVVKIGSTLTITSQGVVEVNTGTIGTKGYIDAKIAELIGSAPEYLNTLEELATAIESSGSTIQSLLTQMGSKVDKVTGKQLSTNDFTNAYKDKVDTLSNYSHPTGAGNNHIPSGGTTNQFLKWSSNGVAVWGAIDWSMIGSKPSIFPTNWDNVAGKPSTFTPSTHTHDYVVATDKRDVKPNTTGIGANVKGIKPFFASINGMNGATGGAYGDLLVMDTYTDNSGGNVNALFFEKNSKRIKHYQAGQAATAWGTAHDLAYLTDITWGNLAGKVDVTTSVSGLMSAADKVKLNGIATGANNYSHPPTHPASVIVQDANNRFVTDAEKTAWNGKANASHGNHVPTVQTANNQIFLRNDGNWATVTPANIGAATANHGHTSVESATYMSINNTESKSVGRLQFFQTSGNTAIMPGGGWYSLLRMQHGGYANGYWQDLAISFDSDNLYFRRNVNGSLGSWRHVWHNGNFNPGNYNANKFSNLHSLQIEYAGADFGIELHRPGVIAYKIISDSGNNFNICQSNGSGTWVKTLMTVNTSGHLRASAVYNAVWNDYAEYFPKVEGYVTEAGDIIALSLDEDKEIYELATENHIIIVGAHSDQFGHLIGGDEPPIDYKGTFTEYNEHKFIPVGLVGRIPVKFKGVARKGMKVVPSDEPGVGREFDRTRDDYDKVIGYIVENNNEDGVRRVKIKIGK
ncbi:MAG: hypothetical protein ACRC92_26370 [Peptostreptococcaceae bacterium]